MKKHVILFFMSVFFTTSQTNAYLIHNDIQQAYEQSNVWGVSTSLDLHNCDPDLIRSSEAIKSYVKQLCDLIDMKRFGDCQVIHFGEDENVAGYSMIQLIETSLISGHFANLTNAVYIDIFSCKMYNPKVVAEFTKQFFNADEVTIHVVLRI